MLRITSRGELSFLRLSRPALPVLRVFDCSSFVNELEVLKD